MKFEEYYYENQLILQRNEVKDYLLVVLRRHTQPNTICELWWKYFISSTHESRSTPGIIIGPYYISFMLLLLEIRVMEISCFCFANDTTLYISHSNIDKLHELVDKQVNDQYVWFCSNKLSLHVQKYRSEISRWLLKLIVLRITFIADTPTLRVMMNGFVCNGQNNSEWSYIARHDERICMQWSEQLRMVLHCASWWTDLDAMVRTTPNGFYCGHSYIARHDERIWMQWSEQQYVQCTVKHWASIRAVYREALGVHTCSVPWSTGASIRVAYREALNVDSTQIHSHVSGVIRDRRAYSVYWTKICDFDRFCRYNWIICVKK